MKNRVFGFLMSALFLAPTLLSAQSLRLSVRAEAPVLETVQVEGLSFTTVRVAGFGQTSRVGLPALPFKVEMMEVPQGATPSLVVDEVESYVIDLAEAGFPHRIFPAQRPRSKNPAHNINKFFYDTAVYAAYRAPSSPVTLGGEATLRDLRIGYLHITPVVYHPESHTLEVFTRIDYHVDFEGADWAATQEFKARYASVAYGGFERNLLNPLRGRLAAKSAVYTQRPVYVIVSYPKFRDSLQKFVQWKTLMGFRVVEAYTDEIGNEDTSIRAYLKKLYDEATPENPAPSYVLFVGDVAQVPSHDGTYDQNYRDPYWYEPHVSDFYYCEYTGDRLPDVLYGRMSATNVDNLMAQIDKLMYMENIPYEKTAFLDSTFLVAGIDKDFGESHLNPTIKYLNTIYYKDSASRHCDAYYYPGSYSAENKIIANINAGVSVGIYTAHGEWDRWERPRISNTSLAGLTNKDKYPLLIGNCCLTGQFNKSTCFAETLLRKKDAGAVAYIGASNSSYFDEDVYWAIGYNPDTLLASTVHTYANTGLGANDAFFHTHGEPYSQWALSVAEIMQTGNMQVEISSADSVMKVYYWQIYHVFGDPSYRPYNHRPVAISADYPRWFRPGELDVFEVSTWPYAWVSLVREGEGIAFAMADERGRAVLDVSGVTEECRLSLCISAQNGLPVLDRILVAEEYVANEKGGASPQSTSLRISVVRAHNGELSLSLCSPQGEVSGELRLLSATGSTLAVLDRSLRVGVEAETHTYKVADLPSGLYLCTFTPRTGRAIGCKFVVR